MTEPSDSDPQLMLRFAGGDADAFDLIYRRYERPVFHYLLRNVRSAALANDLAQETWMAVIRGAASYRPRARFSTWLFTLAHHRLIDAIRDAKKRRPVADAAAEDAGGVEQVAADPSTSPPVALQRREDAAALLRAVEQLPAEQRHAFLLHAEADLSLEEIAQVTGTGRETVKSRLRYARTKLRQLLWEYA